MRGLSLIFVLSLLAARLAGQESGVELPFNQQKEHRVGLGFAVTGFGSNFAYFVSPHYAYRYQRHLLGFTPFYGNLEGLRKHHDMGIGLDYRLYPFKNLNTILLYFPVGLHYNYGWSETTERSALLYKVGFGVETLVGKRWALSLDANFGIGQALGSKHDNTETIGFGTPQGLDYYFLPIIRISYRH